MWIQNSPPERDYVPSFLDRGWASAERSCPLSLSLRACCGMEGLPVKGVTEHFKEASKSMLLEYREAWPSEKAVLGGLFPPLEVSF